MLDTHDINIALSICHFLLEIFHKKFQFFLKILKIIFLKMMFNKINQKWCFMNDQGENLKKNFKRYQNRPILSDRKTQISGSHVRICFYSWNYSFLCYYFGRNGFSDLEILGIDTKISKIDWELTDLEDF